MITMFFIVGCLLTFLFLRRKKEIEKYGNKKRILYYFYKNSLDFLVPFVIVTSIYLMLALAISSDSATLNFLIRLEEALAQVKSLFSIFKLNAIQALIVLLGLFFLGILRSPSEKSGKLFALFDKYQSFVRRIYVILVLLCSFTFFGTQLGEPSKNLSLHIKTIRDGYADLYNEVHDTIAEEVAIQLYPKVHDSFPQPYQDALELPIKIEQETDSLREYYSSFLNEFGTKDRNLEALLDRSSLRARSATDLKVEVSDVERKRIDNFALPDPQHINYKKIENAKSAVSDYRKNKQPRIVELLKIEGGKKVTCQIPKVFTGEVKKELFKKLIIDYPILEPLIDVFFRTLDKQIETQVEQEIDRVVNTAIQNPEDIDKPLEEQATIIASHRNIEITKADLEASQRTSNELRNKLISIEKIRKNLFKSITPKEATSELNSNLSVDVSWSSVPYAQSYRVYWLPNKDGSIINANSEKTNNTSINLWPDNFPSYYKIVAVRGNWESMPSKSHRVALLSDEKGTRCQICGAKSIGYCTMRHAYVCEQHHTFTARGGGGWICP